MAPPTKKASDPAPYERPGGQLAVQAELNGVRVPLLLDEAALAAIAAAIAAQRAPVDCAASPLLSIVEAAGYLRCKRQRIDDLLSQRRLARVKDGRRTLIRRDELEHYLNGRLPGRTS
jgi:excisionase family DNA binding protein